MQSEEMKRNRKKMFFFCIIRVKMFEFVFKSVGKSVRRIPEKLLNTGSGKYCEFISSYFRFSVSMHPMIAFRQVCQLPIVITTTHTLVMVSFLSRTEHIREANFFLFIATFHFGDNIKSHNKYCYLAVAVCVCVFFSFVVFRSRLRLNYLSFTFPFHSNSICIFALSIQHSLLLLYIY